MSLVNYDQVCTTRSELSPSLEHGLYRSEGYIRVRLVAVQTRAANTRHRIWTEALQRLFVLFNELFDVR